MKNRAQRSKVTVDLKRNRLVITVTGTLRKADLDSLYTDIRFAVGDLQKGFDVITDMSNCRIGYLSGISTYLKIQKFLQDSGVYRIVRVTGTSKTFFQQILRVTKDNDGYSPVYVDSMKEAEEFLAQRG